MTREVSMTEVTVDYHGKQVTASLSSTQTLSGETLPGNQAPMWYVTIGGTALTKLPARSGETEEQVSARVFQWLDEHPELLDRDQIILGGG
jgi:hypothetical protein